MPSCELQFSFEWTTSINIPPKLSSGTSIFVIVAFTTVALSGALIAAFAVILGFRTFPLPRWMLRLFAHHSPSVAILVSILAAVFFTSIALTVLVVSAYITLQFAILVRREGISGVAGWASETKRQLNERWQNGFGQTSDIRTPGIGDDNSKVTMVSKSGNN